MKGLSIFLVSLLIVINISLLFYVLIGQYDIPVLNPQGYIAQKQRDLIIIASLLASLVLVPVFILTYLVVAKYKDGDKNGKYYSEIGENNKLQLILWLIPFFVISVLAIITWRSTHELDPRKVLDAPEKPVTIQVVALRWKWLFIYPEENIATVNFVQFPHKTPVRFEMTSDGPMNSFWIPALSGQMYSMAAMETHLNLIADKSGDYKGYAAEINGAGFSGMKFTARASSKADFEKWINSIKQSPQVLSQGEYEKLARPSENNKQTFYSSVEKDLYDGVIKKFMATNDMNGHNK